MAKNYMQKIQEALASGDPERIREAIGAMNQVPPAGEAAAQSGSQRALEGYMNSRKKPIGNIREDSHRAAQEMKKVNSVEGQSILDKHSRLRESNPKAADKIEMDAFNAKAKKDWREKNPGAGRGPNSREIFKSIAIMGMNQNLRNLALVDYYPSVDTKELDKKFGITKQAKTQAPTSPTPTYDKLSVDDQIKVRWAVNKKYNKHIEAAAAVSKRDGEAVGDKYHKSVIPNFNAWESHELEQSSIANIAGGLATSRAYFPSEMVKDRIHDRSGPFDAGSDAECSWLTKATADTQHDGYHPAFSDCDGAKELLGGIKAGETPSKSKGTISSAK